METLLKQSGIEAGRQGRLPACHTDLGMWRWLLSFATPYWRIFAFVLVLSLLVAAAGLAQPYMTKTLIDDGILAGSFDRIVWCVAVLVGLAVLSMLISGLVRHLYVNASARVLHDMRATMFDHLLLLSPDFYARTRQGDLHVRLNNDIGELQRFMVDALLGLINNSFMLVGAVVMLGYMSGELLLLLLMVLLLNSIFLKLIRPRVELLNQQARDRGADIAAFFVEILSLAKCVQMFNGQRRERERLNFLQEDLRLATLRLQVTSYLAGAVPGLVMSLSIATVFLIGGYRITEGVMSLGVLIAFVTYMQRANGPVQAMMGLYVSYQRARVSLSRIRELYRQQPAVVSPGNHLKVPVCGHGELRLENLSYCHSNAQEPVLKGLGQFIPAGSKVLVRGASGAGKSTLVDLLQRHFDPLAGRILLDGVDLRQYDLEQLRRMVVVVSQDAWLFSSSMLENIRYGQPEADERAVVEAARAAGVDEFTQRLEMGYQTLLGQRGALLSGGQRQRVALARALLMRPAVLILDESTSGLDVEQERLVHLSIDQAFGHCTRLFISHRPAMLEVAFDVVIDLDQ
ncbi:Lipid A export ATP-binding/permease protein MsbA [compost metagenome]